KEVATVDWLSGGRFDFGVGVGWLAEEFRALDVPFERRGDRCREYLEVMRRLWCDPVSAFAGSFYDLPASRQYPKPVQQPHPPIYFGGESDAALPRGAPRGPGRYPVAPRAGGVAGPPRRPRPHARPPGAVAAGGAARRLSLSATRRPRPREALPRGRRRSGGPDRVRSDARRA